LLASVDAETMRQGRTPKPRTNQKPTLQVIAEPAGEKATAAAGTIASADPTTSGRPLLSRPPRTSSS
jgi:hypothetical protein